MMVTLKKPGPAAVIAGHRARVLLSALLPLAMIMLVGCGSGSSSDGERSGPRLAVDEQHGTVEGVGLGDNAERIERVFGDSPPWKQAADFYPLGPESEDVTFPAGRRYPPGRANALRYRGVSFFLIGDETLDVYVTSERARTRRGLRPGDRLERGEDLYPELKCDVTDVSADFPVYEPACWGELRGGTYVWIGGDPINNIQLSATRVRGTGR